MAQAVKKVEGTPCQTLEIGKVLLPIEDKLDYLEDKPDKLKIVSYNCEWCADPDPKENGRMKFILDSLDKTPPPWGLDYPQNKDLNEASKALTTHLEVCICIYIYIFTHIQIIMVQF